MSDSTNWNIDRRDVDWTPSVNTGYPADLAAEDSLERMASVEGMTDFPDALWIEPSQWKDVARENDLNQTWPDNYRSRRTHQGNTHECTCHALLQNFEIAWNRQRQSLGAAVWLSALSVYAEANPRRRGGATMQGTLSIARARGILPEHNGPAGTGDQRNRFRHTLNLTEANGGWKNIRDFPSGWQETAGYFRPLEYINIRSWEQHVCCVLQGYAVSNGRYGHAIPHVAIRWQGNDLFSEYSDSYNVARHDSVRAIKDGVSGAYAIRTTTIPDDWTQPAPPRSSAA